MTVDELKKVGYSFVVVHSRWSIACHVAGIEVTSSTARAWREKTPMLNTRMEAIEAARKLALAHLVSQRLEE